MDEREHIGEGPQFELLRIDVGEDALEFLLVMLGVVGRLHADEAVEQVALFLSVTIAREHQTSRFAYN